MRTRVLFQYKGFDIIAQGIVLNSGAVSRLELWYEDLDREFWPTSSELIEEIQDMATQLMIEEINTPEVNF